MPPKTSKERLEGVTEFGAEIMWELSLRKLHSDMSFVENIFLDLLAELKEQNCFNAFYQTIEVAKDIQDKKAQFIAMYSAQKWKARPTGRTNYLQNLRRELDINRKNTSFLLQEKKRDINEAETRLQTIALKIPEVDKKEKNSMQVQKMELMLRLKKEEEEKEEKILFLEKDEPCEKDIHSLFSAFLTFTIEERRNLLSYWKDKCEKDFSEGRENVSILQEKLNQKESILTDLENHIISYQEEIAKYEKQKEEERGVREEEEKLVKAALRIQAWWRGTLVRRGITACVIKKHKKRSSKSK